MSYYQNQPEKIYNDKITIYQTTDTKADGSWYYRFRNMITNKGYIRRSSKTIEKAEAIAIAIKHYDELKMRSSLGITTTTTTIRQLLDCFIDELDEGVRNTTEMLYNSYWKEHFGERDLYYLSDDDVKAYIDWRVRPENIRHTRILKGGIHGNPYPIDERRVNKSTIIKDRRMLKWLMKRAFDRRMIANMPNFTFSLDKPTIKELPTQQRRARLTEEQAKTMKLWLTQFKRKWAITLEEEYLEEHARITPNVIKNKWKPEHPFNHGRHRYNAIMFYMICRLALTTGLRPQEIKLIRWKDINPVYDDGNKRYTYISIRAEVSKTNKYRDAVSNDFDRTYKRLENWKIEWEKRFGRIPKEEDYVFSNCMFVNKPHSHFWHLIRGHLARIDKWAQERGHAIVSYNTANDLNEKKYITLYSFRSRHITMMIRHEVSPYLLARNAGTSVEMINSFYNINSNIMHREKFTAFLGNLIKNDAIDDE